MSQLLSFDDKELIPRANNPKIYTSGCCYDKQQLECDGGVCNNCAQHHKLFIEMCSADHYLLNHSIVQCIYRKCNSISCGSFTIRTLELGRTNFSSLQCLLDQNCSLDSHQTLYLVMSQRESHPLSK